MATNDYFAVLAVNSSAPSGFPQTNLFLYDDSAQLLAVTDVSNNGVFSLEISSEENKVFVGGYNQIDPNLQLAILRAYKINPPLEWAWKTFDHTLQELNVREHRLEVYALADRSIVGCWSTGRYTCLPFVLRAYPRLSLLLGGECWSRVGSHSQWLWSQQENRRANRFVHATVGHERCTSFAELRQSEPWQRSISNVTVHFPSFAEYRCWQYHEVRTILIVDLS